MASLNKIVELNIFYLENPFLIQNLLNFIYSRRRLGRIQPFVERTREDGFGERGPVPTRRHNSARGPRLAGLANLRQGLLPPRTRPADHFVKRKSIERSGNLLMKLRTLL